MKDPVISFIFRKNQWSFSFSAYRLKKKKQSNWDYFFVWVVLYINIHAKFCPNSQDKCCGSIMQPKMMKIKNEILKHFEDAQNWDDFDNVLNYFRGILSSSFRFHCLLNLALLEPCCTSWCFLMMISFLLLF